MTEEKINAALAALKAAYENANRLADACLLLAQAVKKSTNLELIGLEAIMRNPEPEEAEKQEEK